MAKILEFLIKFKVVFIVAGLIILTVIIVGALGNYYDTKSDELRGYYEGKLDEAKVEALILTEEIAHKTEYIAQLETENILLIETRIKDERRANLLLAEVERLQAIEPSQPKLEDEPLVINLREQVYNLTLAVDAKEQIIQGNDKIIFNLTEKYNAQLVISYDYKKLYETEKELHALAIDRLKVADSRIRGLRFGSKLKTVGIIAGLGAIGYLLLGGN